MITSVNDTRNDTRTIISIENDYERALGFLLLGSTGVWYTTQAGGMSCLHPEAEGAWVPYPRIESLKLDCRGCYGGPLTPKEADEINAMLKEAAVPLQVDRDRLAASMEAWVYCLTLLWSREWELTARCDRDIPGVDLGIDMLAPDLPAILIWGNCD